MYVPVWSRDILQVLGLRDPDSSEGQRALNMNVGVSIPDLIMDRINRDMQRCRDKVPHAEPVMVSLFSPDQHPRLALTHGAEFEELYLALEKDPSVERYTLPASVIMNRIAKSILLTGEPYVYFPDAANAKSNQSNRGTIAHSNLCTEIVQYSAPDETAVCNLGSLNLPKFVRAITPGGPLMFDHEMLSKVTGRLVVALNRVIDRMDYPTPATKLSNERMRPTGVGIQGLATVFALLGLPYDSDEARQLNLDIASTIYYAALDRSCDLAMVDEPYPFFEGSPASQGLLQFDLWNLEAESLGRPPKQIVTRSVSEAAWEGLKERIKQYGLRNSLLVAPMPTTSTSIILGNGCAPSFEVPKGFAKTTMSSAGPLDILDRTLVQALQVRGLWTPEVRDQLIKDYGSIQHIACIPDDIKRIFRTAWEVPLRAQIEMAADRGLYIDQSQSLNMHLDQPSGGRVWLGLKRAHELRLKTTYYWVVPPKKEARGTNFGLSAELATGATKTSAAAEAPAAAAAEGAVAEGAACEVGCTSCSS